MSTPSLNNDQKYGHWNSVYNRFARWADKDIWHNMHQYFVDDPDTVFNLCSDW